MASSSTPAEAEAFPDGTTDYIPLRKGKFDTRKAREYLPAFDALAAGFADCKVEQISRTSR